MIYINASGLSLNPKAVPSVGRLEFIPRSYWTNLTSIMSNVILSPRKNRIFIYYSELYFTMTTIQISSELQQELNKMKLFSRETYEEVIWNIIEDTKELSEQTRKDIALSRKEISEGKFVTLSDLKKKYNLQ